MWPFLALNVKQAIPMVMGANIGTSVTSTFVAMGQINVRKEFERAFAGATVHDMFNWLTVIVLLPVEICTGYLLWLSGLMVSNVKSDSSEESVDLPGLKTITKPLTDLIVIVRKDQIVCSSRYWTFTWKLLKIRVHFSLFLVLFLNFFVFRSKSGIRYHKKSSERIE